MKKPLAFSNELAVAAALSPQERLAVSRKALVRHMSHDTRPEVREDESRVDANGSDRSDEPPSARASRSVVFSGTLGLLKRGLLTWWRHHPAHFAVSVAQPVLGRYARQNPFRLLAISAGVGAALVVLKPWRLVSMGGIALATLKSSEFSGLLMSVLSSVPEETDPPGPA